MRGWTLDVYNQITQLPTLFSLQEAYTYEALLARLHPESKHIKPKIRQQLQILRDIGLLEFKGRGGYKLKLRTLQSRLFQPQPTIPERLLMKQHFAGYVSKRHR